MTSRLSSVSLLEVEPDLAGVLSDKELAAARLFLLPVAAVDQGGDVAWLLAPRSARLPPARLTVGRRAPTSPPSLSSEARAGV